MPGLTFLNAIFLTGLAAGAVPIIIHLFSRRKGRRVEFSSIRFLREINRKQIRRVKLRQTLVLLLRVAAVCLLALAMGRPALRGGAFAAKGLASSAVCILLDTSFSMSAETEENRSLFSTAQDRAQEVVDMMGEEDEGHLVLVSDAPKVSFESAVRDRGMIRREIGEAKASQRGTDFRRALRRAAILLEGSKRLNKEIFLISDMQRSGWGLDQGEAVDFPEGIRVYCVSVSGGLPNVAVRDVELLEALSPGREGKVRVAVSNHTGESLGQVPVTVSVQETHAGEGYVDFSGGELATTVIPLGAGGGVWGEASIREDVLPLDDRRYFTAPTVRKAPVLVVDGSGLQSRDNGDAEFVRLALSPGESVESPYDPKVVGASELAGEDLTTYDAVVLCNVGRLAADDISALKNFVTLGGGLVIFLGDRVDARFYNEYLLPDLLDATILGTKGSVGPDAGFTSLVVSASGHPVFDGFPAAAGQKLTRAKFSKVAQLNVGDGARVLAHFSDGLPAVAASDGVVMMASSADMRWNNLPSSGAFLPLIHQMVSFASRGGPGGGAGLLVGSPLEVLVGPEWEGAEIFHLGPTGLLSRVLPRKVGVRVQLRVDETTEAGVHMFVSGGDTLGVFAVNVDPSESDLSPASVEEMEKVVPSEQLRLFVGEDSLERQISEARVGREVWRLGVFGVVLLLGAELFAGRGRGSEN
jgi:hypothetical protein